MVSEKKERKQMKGVERLYSDGALALQAAARKDLGLIPN